MNRCHAANTAQLAHLDSSRTIGAKPGNGYYFRSRPTVIKHRFAYNREIIRAIDNLGCFFPEADCPDQWTGLGDVDVVFLDKKDQMIGATVNHGGMIITPEDEDKDGLPH